MTEQKILNLLDDSGSSNRDAIRETTYQQDYIFQGKMFKIENVLSIGSGDTSYDVAFDTTGMTRGLVALPTTWATTAGPVIITLASCTSYTGGTALTPLNRHYEFQTSYQSEVTFKYDVTPSGYVASETSILVGTSATNQSSDGGSTSGTLPIVLETGIKYIFRVNNGSGENISLYAIIDWYET